MPREYRITIKKSSPSFSEQNIGKDYFCHFVVADYVTEGTGEALRDFGLVYGVTKIDALDAMMKEIKAELAKDDESQS